MHLVQCIQRGYFGGKNRAPCLSSKQLISEPGSNKGIHRGANAQDTLVLILPIAFQFLPALLSTRSSAGPCQTSTGRCTTCQNCQTQGKTTSSDSTRRLRWSSMSVGVLSAPQPPQGAPTRALPASSTRTNQLPDTSTLETFKMAQGEG